MAVGLCEITTSLGGDWDGKRGGSLLSCSLFSAVGLVEPDFKESIAATAASSSGTRDSSAFSSERVLVTVAGFPGDGGRLVGVTTFGAV